MKIWTKFEEAEVDKKLLEYFDGDKLASDVAKRKYLLTDHDGDYVEATPADIHKRLALEVEKFSRIHGDGALLYEDVYTLLDKYRFFLMQGSMQSAIGDDFRYQSSSNCYVVPLPEDSYGGICTTDQHLVQIMKRRGGVGTGVHSLRPKGMLTANAARTTDGIVPFMQRFSNSTEEVAQGNRRGALMLTCSVHHPQIEDFINAKLEEGKIEGANISVLFTDEFMQALEKDEDYEQRWPVDSETPEVSRMVSAKKIWNLAVKAAWTRAEPGAIFIDKMNSYNPASVYSKVIGTNPCVVGSTLVSTASGLQRVEDLKGPVVLKINGELVATQGFFATGEKPVYRLRTRQGYSVVATKDHRICTPNGWVELGQLSNGDAVCLANQRSKNDIVAQTDLYQHGWLLGMMVGDGGYNPSSYYGYCRFWGPQRGAMYALAAQMLDQLGGRTPNINTEHEPITLKSARLDELARDYIEPHSKDLQDRLLTAPPDMIAGFLSGIFDADGSVQGTQEKGYSIRLSQSNERRLQQIQIMLSQFGIQSTIRQAHASRTKSMPDGSGGYKEYACKANYELIITKDNMVYYNRQIGFQDEIKRNALANIIDSYKRGPHGEKFTAVVCGVDELGVMPVYDVQVPGYNEFSANGIRVHNCGEIPLPAYGCCRLGCMNLFGFVFSAFKESANFDWILFQTAARQAARILDTVVDIESHLIDRILQKINSDPQNSSTKHIEKELWENIKRTNDEERRIGLGITGLADAMAALGIKYGSKESVEFTEKIYKTLCYSAYAESIQLAKERGAFPLYNYELEKDNDFIQHFFSEFPELEADYKKHGRRNIALLTTAPVGSLSTQSQTSNGIEAHPFLFVERKRRKMSGEPHADTDVVDKLGRRWTRYRFVQPKVKEWMKAKGIEDISDIKESPFVTTDEIDWTQGVAVQAAAQKWVDHSISRTTNLPANATIEDVDNIFINAYKMGCKGITVYREGTRDAVLKRVQDSKTALGERPEEVPCDIYTPLIKGEPWVVLVGVELEQPYELFGGLAIDKETKELLTVLDSFGNKHSLYELLKNSKNIDGAYLKKRRFSTKRNEYDLYLGEVCIKDIVGQLNNPDHGVLTRFISTSLRSGVPLRHIIKQLEQDKDSNFTSFAKVICRVLRRYDKMPISGKDVFPECEKPENCEIVNQEGCTTCVTCGRSKCS